MQKNEVFSRVFRRAAAMFAQAKLRGGEAFSPTGEVCPTGEVRSGGAKKGLITQPLDRYDSILI